MRKKYLGIEIDYSRDNDIPEQGLALLTGKGFYKKTHENSPQETFARAATCYSFGDKEFAQRIYDYASKGWFTFASPVLTNAQEVEWPNFEQSDFAYASDWMEDNVEPDGMPISCFVAGTPVFTKCGIKSIEDIHIGDEVLTHKGRFKQVTNTRKSTSSDLYKLRCSRNTTELTVTGNHLMLTNNGWKRVDELKKGVDLLATSGSVEMPTPATLTLPLAFDEKAEYNSTSFKAKTLPESVEVDEDLAWALGFWFAEGSTSDNGQVRVTHGDEEPCEKWQKIVASKLGVNGKSYKANGRNWYNGEVNSVGLQRVFDKLFGKGCKDKKIPDAWMINNWHSQVFEQFLAGFYLGDGFKTNSTKMFEITNVVLASQIALLLMANGYDVTGQYRKYIHHNRSKNNGVYNAVVSYRTRYEKSKVSVRNGVPMPDGLLYATIDTLETLETAEQDVYDIEVEDDASFSVAGVIAHNCFLSYIPDTKEGLVNARSEAEWLSMMGGGVGVYAGMRSPDEKSTGVMAHMRGYDADTLSYKQTENRRGSMAAYLDIDHPEIMSFIDMRTPVGGDQNKKCFNLNNAVNITDKFMEAVIRGEKYELVDPKHGGTGRFLDAKEVWEHILETRYETGEPYIMFKDTVNRNIPSWITHPLYNVSQSNLCSEITLRTTAKRTAVCCLSSVNLEKFDEWKNTTMVADLIRLLDNVLEYFIRLAPPTLSRAVHSARKERALGLGTLGWHSYLQRNMIPFESQESLAETVKIYSIIRTAAIEESQRLAKLRGEPDDCRNSGMRNSHLLAIAPNASSSAMVGASPSIEPWNANAFNAQGRAGSFLIKNKYLKRILRDKDMDTNEVWRSIITNEGSVQHLDFLSEHEKLVFRTATEIDPEWAVELAAERQKDICQSQSLNIFVPNGITKQKMSDIHIKGWLKGVKTFYYCRSKPATRANLGTGGKKPLNSVPVVEESECRACEA